jgi:hypothetical protein
MTHVLQKVSLTILDGFCGDGEMQKAKEQSIETKEPPCPLPLGIEIPFVVGKISFDCEGWGFEVGEGIVLNFDNKISGETTIAIGPGEVFRQTPRIGKEEYSLNPGIDVNAKGQLFFTFQGSTLIDGGFLCEAEIDFKGLGKPAELKQNFTWAVNKGFTYDGILTDIGDKIFNAVNDIHPEIPVNKNVKAYKPSN